VIRDIPDVVARATVDHRHMRRHLTYANVISSLCLFILLGGSAVAAVAITGKQVKNNSLTSVDIKNGTLRGVDFGSGVLPPAGSSQTGAPGPQGPKGEPGPQGPVGRQGEPGPGAVPIALSLPMGEFQLHEFDAGTWTVGFNCTNREDRPQVQVWARSDAGGEGQLQWAGIRSHSSDPSFITNSGSPLDTQLRSLDSRWAPDNGFAAVDLTMHYRSGAKAGTVSFHMMADDRGAGPSTCTVAGTAIPS
jgi:hypothetical protein